jgi:hypothetical protein
VLIPRRCWVLIGLNRIGSGDNPTIQVSRTLGTIIDLIPSFMYFNYKRNGGSEPATSFSLKEQWLLYIPADLT